MKKLIKNLASLKLAVVVMSSMAILVAAGTIIESKYDAEAASKWVYRSIWMYSVMGLFAANLTAVMADRWPWQKKHIPFILAHIGILLLLLGAWVTVEFGLDGTISFGMGQKNKFVRLNDTEIVVWSSFDGDRYSKVYEQPVDFFINRPQTKPLTISLFEDQIQFVEYIPYSLASKVIEENKTDPRAGAALRFQLQNSRVNTTEWIIQRKNTENAEINFGPATFHLGKAPAQSVGVNEIYFTPTENSNENKIDYVILYKDISRPPLRGHIKEGDVIKTGWMDLELRVLRYFPKAQERWNFKPVERPTPLTTPAVRFQFHGQDYWLALDDTVKVFTDKAVYIVSYVHKRIELNFDLTLKEFKMEHYPGTQRAASYQSLVEVPEIGEKLISMNEPLKYQGLTFYQASFENGPDGKPQASILSVNFDPGRWLKYLGSLILSLGVVWLFYDKRKAASAAARRANEIAHEK